MSLLRLKVHIGIARGLCLQDTASNFYIQAVKVAAKAVLFHFPSIDGIRFVKR